MHNYSVSFCEFVKEFRTLVVAGDPSRSLLSRSVLRHYTLLKEMGCPSHWSQANT